jgi:cyclic beta-1,2-glucan synthetase
MRRRANEAADELVRLTDPAKAAEYLKTLEPLAEDNTFSTQFLYRMRDGSQASSVAIAWLDEQLETLGRDTEETTMAEHSRLSSGNVTMGNIIRSLREIDDTEWSVWVEQVSHVDKLLWEHSDYGILDSGSRNKYRKQIEKLAKRSTMSEMEIAQLALDMTDEAKASGEEQPHEPNVGGFLTGMQRPKLEARSNYLAVDRAAGSSVDGACHVHRRSFHGERRHGTGGNHPAAGDVLAARIRRGDRPFQHGPVVLRHARAAGWLRIQGRNS